MRITNIVSFSFDWLLLLLQSCLFVFLRRLDVLIDMEEVIGIEFRFETSKSIVVLSIGLSDSLVVLFHEEVNVTNDETKKKKVGLFLLSFSLLGSPLPLILSFSYSFSPLSLSHFLSSFSF